MNTLYYYLERFERAWYFAAWDERKNRMPRMTALALALGTFDALLWILIIQFFGPQEIREINFLIGKYSLPFGISRLWDIMIIPVCTLFIATVGTSWGMREEDGTVGLVGNLLAVSAVVGAFSGLVCGAIYALLWFVFTLVMSIAAVAIICFFLDRSKGPMGA